MKTCEKSLKIPKGQSEVMNKSWGGIKSASLTDIFRKYW